MRPMAFLSSITRNHSGATAVEFALIAPVFFLLICGLIELALVLFALTGMEGAASIIARSARTGYAPPSISILTNARQEFDRLTGGLLQADQLDFQVLSYQDFSNIGQAEPCLNIDCTSYTDINGNGRWDADQGVTNSTGDGNEVVVFRINYPWPIFTPIARQLLTNGDGTFPLSVAITVKNEDF